MRRGAALGLALVATLGSAGGCTPIYRPGSALRGEALVERQSRCLDLRVTRHQDRAVEQRGWLALRYELGNRCGEAVAVDLGAARVVRLGDGALQPLRGQESVTPALLEARGYATEVLAYGTEPGLADYCVTLAGVAEETERVDPVCFEAVETGSPSRVAK